MTLVVAQVGLGEKISLGVDVVYRWPPCVLWKGGFLGYVSIYRVYISLSKIQGLVYIL
jgi:hypothetical protein